ncbi:MAG TPA: hypothetical protein VF691_12465, partial [Cytophagaceae bacterium]
MMINLRNIKFYFCFLCLLFGNSQGIHAQDARQVIKSVNEVFTSCDAYSLDLIYTVFPSYTSSKPVSISKGRFDKV